MVKINISFKIILLLFVQFSFSQKGLEKGFEYLDEFIPNIVFDLRYGSEDNFTGKVVKGYENPRPVSTIEMAKALKEVQIYLELRGLGLKIFDAYRPQKAVDYFFEWSKVKTDTLMKSKYYPNEKKENLFKHGYISKLSGHSRGSSVDLTIIHLIGEKAGEEIDMGSSWDYFGEKSSISSTKINLIQRKNRIILKNLMQMFGFLPYEKEWWHFTIKKEPFPNKYFDFPTN
ncbi:MAG: peptidase M15 [Flavobacteriaceae bacterium]|nr:peptidase M15 [Flavobacteriaceae bacterium]|tara:strand:+ start:1722 stop:2411 length:690 start_codon:yes stop_codon:yes gene_type:complete